MFPRYLPATSVILLSHISHRSTPHSLKKLNKNQRHPFRLPLYSRPGARKQDVGEDTILAVSWNPDFYVAGGGGKSGAGGVGGCATNDSASETVGALLVLYLGLLANYNASGGIKRRILYPITTILISIGYMPKTCHSRDI